MSVAEIAESPIAGAELYEYVRAEKDGSGLLIYMRPVSSITAGTPYLVKWDPTEPELIPMPLVFHDVHITALVGDTIGEPNEIRFAGNIAIGTVVLGNNNKTENHLFLGEANTLYWPDQNETRLRGFRAHFRVPVTGNNAVSQGAPARIVVNHQTTTDVERVDSPDVRVHKLIIDGQVYIVRDGKLYTILGQDVK